MTARQELYQYRREQALTTLDEAQRMLESGFSARSIVNRAYYAMFYMVLALLLKRAIQVTTSKHTGVMSVFDKEFVLTGEIDRKHSKALHKTFDRRVEFDYKELIAPPQEEARGAVAAAREFIEAIDALS